MKKTIRQFSEIDVNAVPLVGGKGANLGEMTRAGLPVPPGFCVTADAYREFTLSAQKTITQILESTLMDDPEDVERNTARLRGLIISQPMPAEIEQEIKRAYSKLTIELLGGVESPRNSSVLPVAVRSSATAEDLPDASFAGQQDTYLNVRGDEQLLEHVKRCWASLWTARAVTYRHRHGYDHNKVALAVVVQAMIESQVAGILFTANPVNNRRDETVLNASWGLGEAIVSGLVTPDTWVTHKSGEILEREIATKEIAIEYAKGGGTREVAVPLDKSAIACLSDEEVRALVALGERVENHYARPMDIEWGYAHEKFYMLQARPITTLQASASGPLPSVTPARIASSEKGEYNRTMFIEIFPDPLSPAFLSVIAPLFHSMLDFTFETLGFTPPKGIPAIGIFFSQPYFHREYIQAALAPLSPAVQEALVSQFVNPFGRHERKLPTEASPAFLGMVTRLLRFMTGFPKQLPGLLSAYRAEIERFDALPFSKMSELEIIARVRELLFKHASKLLNYDFLMIALIGITYQTLGSLLDRYYGEGSEQVRAKLISGVTGNVTMETNKRIWILAQEAKHSPTVRELIESNSLDAPFPAVVSLPGSIQIPNAPTDTDQDLREALARDGDGRIFLALLDAFLDEYGHREVRMDILYPTWGEDPSPVLQFIRGYFDADDQASPFVQQGRLVREREKLAREVDEHVQRDLAGRVAISPLFHWMLQNTQEHTRERDTMHFELTRLFPPFRRALLELAVRWQGQGLIDEQQDVFFLTLEEMEALSEAPRLMQGIVQERRAEFEHNTINPAPPLLRDGISVQISRAPVDIIEGQWRGIAGSPGIVEGIVRVIHGPQEFQKLRRGEILVAPLTNPVWTPLFAIAGGIITQVGGILSHGAIVAREYGIPAVMAVHDATTILSDGQRVIVDGNRGIVILREQNDV